MYLSSESYREEGQIIELNFGIFRHDIGAQDGECFRVELLWRQALSSQIPFATSVLHWPWVDSSSRKRSFHHKDGQQNPVLELDALACFPPRMARMEGQCGNEAPCLSRLHDRPSEEHQSREPCLEVEPECQHHSVSFLHCLLGLDDAWARDLGEPPFDAWEGKSSALSRFHSWLQHAE